MKIIRILTFSIVVLLCGINAAAQGIKIYKSNGAVINIPYSRLDSIVNVPAKEFVDMGLSVKWAACNIGAEKPHEYGFYFAWGETESKMSYSEENSMTYGNDLGDISGDIEHDAARAVWGGMARIPTNIEINELCEKCKWERASYFGVEGMLVTGPSGKCIFLPAAGFIVGTSRFGDGTDGYYWSSTPFLNEEKEKDACYLDFDKGYYYWGNWIRRYLGQTVRAVSD